MLTSSRVQLSILPDLVSVVVPTLYVPEIGNHSNQPVRWGCPPFQRSPNPPEDYSDPGKLLCLHRKIIFRVAASENIPKKHNDLGKTQPSSSPPCPTSTNWWPVWHGLRLNRHNGITHLESSQKYRTRQVLLMDVCLFPLGLPCFCSLLQLFLIQLKKKITNFYSFTLIFWSYYMFTCTADLNMLLDFCLTNTITVIP